MRGDLRFLTTLRDIKRDAPHHQIVHEGCVVVVGSVMTMVPYCASAVHRCFSFPVTNKLIRVYGSARVRETLGPFGNDLDQHHHLMVIIWRGPSDPPIPMFVVRLGEGGEGSWIT